ncbi:hypothetical protein ABC345_09215 [Shouchella sp. 1P09AA]|uniref:hypothetical protein n=1 Tax=unclassified Shouchella TaxID=2893065 RepID=UPI0039A31B00
MDNQANENRHIPQPIRSNGAGDVDRIYGATCKTRIFSCCRKRLYRMMKDESVRSFST